MSYNVAIEDVDSVGMWVGSYCSTVAEQLNHVINASMGIADIESFQGAAADNVKAYFGEMHANAANILVTALYDVLARYSLYALGYTDIDSAKHARFNEDTFEQIHSHFSSSRTDIADKMETLSSTLANISDIIYLSTPSSAALDSGLSDLNSKAVILKARVHEHESWHTSNAAGVDDLVAQASQLISALGAYASTGGANYTPGSFYELPFIPDLALALENAQAYQKEHEGIIESAYSAMGARIQERYDEEMARLAQQREEQGILQMIEGGFMFLGGALVTVASGGAAAPVGIAMMAFGASNMIEGAQEFHYGSIGDVTTMSFNPIRDTVFFGNQELYDAASFVVNVVGSFAVPVNAAVGFARATSTSVVKSVAIGIGKEMAEDFIVDTAVSVIADPIIRQVAGDGFAGDVASMITHNGAGMAAGLGGRGGADAPSVRGIGDAPTVRTPTDVASPGLRGVGDVDTPSVARGADVATPVRTPDTSPTPRTPDVDSPRTMSGDGPSPRAETSAPAPRAADAPTARPADAGDSAPAPRDADASPARSTDAADSTPAPKDTDTPAPRSAESSDAGAQPRAEDSAPASRDADTAPKDTQSPKVEDSTPQVKDTESSAPPRDADTPTSKPAESSDAGAHPKVEDSAAAPKDGDAPKVEDSAPHAKDAETTAPKDADTAKPKDADTSASKDSDTTAPKDTDVAPAPKVEDAAPTPKDTDAATPKDADTDGQAPQVEDAVPPVKDTDTAAPKDVDTAERIDLGEKEKTESYSSWKDFKDEYKGVKGGATGFVSDNKPLGSPNVKNWLDGGGKVEVEFYENGHQIWTYTSSEGYSASYVPKMVNGEVCMAIEFPVEHLHPNAAIREIDIGTFTGRNSDRAAAIKWLQEAKIADSDYANYAFHHDVQNGKMILVDEKVHNKFRHYGGHYYHGKS